MMRHAGHEREELSGVKPEPSISIVSPFYNRRDCLAALIATLRDQTFKDFELIIVDDGSTDGLGDEVSGIAADFPVLYIQLDRNCGAAVARNAGIDAARGRYVALLDSDDAWHPDKLRQQYQHLENNQQGRGIVSLTRQVVRGGTPFISPSRVMGLSDEVGDYLFLRGGVIQSSMMMLRRDLAARVRFEQTSQGHDDWSFALRLQAAGARFEMLQGPLTYYDDTAGRLRRSPRYSTARLDWLEKRRTQLGEKAYWAAAAAVASHLKIEDGVNPIGIIGMAYSKKAIRLSRAAYYALAWTFPPFRNCMRRFHQLLLGRKSGWVS